MKRDLNVFMMMPDKKTPMTFAGSSQSLTAGLMIAEATIAMYPNETNLDQKEKSTRFSLSLRCELGGVQSFTAYEIEVILRCCNQKCGTWLYGQMEAWAKGINPFENILKVEDLADDPKDIADFVETPAA